MNKYIERLPKEYRVFIKDFYKDDDGWWISLYCNGDYEFVGSHAQYTMHEDTLNEVLAEFRRCIRHKPCKKYYLAYGSNLNLSQMKSRCPGAELIGYAELENHRLIFRGSGSGSFLSVESEHGKSVKCGVFSITSANERSLDRYEGYPQFYQKKTVTVTMHSFKSDKTESIPAMIYYLPRRAPAGMPTSFYISTCKKGYRDCGFDESALLEAMYHTWEEIK